MKKFIIENDFWEVFPEARLGIIVCTGIDNTVKDTVPYEKMIADAEKEVFNHLKDEEFTNNAVIRVWREAFQKFKTKKGARSSIEALLKRVNNGNHIGTINPLVDIYNAVSLKHALPCGGEDIDTFVGNVRLTKAAGGEHFITLGSDEDAPPYEGEIIYKDDAGAICRCWNWRESVRTMLTENTKNAFLCIESVDETREDALESALKALAAEVEHQLGGVCRTSILDMNNQEMDLI